MDASYEVLQLVTNLTGFVNSKKGLYEQSGYNDHTSQHFRDLNILKLEDILKLQQLLSYA